MLFLTLSRKSDRLTALRRSSPLPTGEGGRVRVHEPKRLRPLTQEAVDEGGLAGAVRPGEEDEGGHGCPENLGLGSMSLYFFE